LIVTLAVYIINSVAIKHDAGAAMQAYEFLHEINCTVDHLCLERKIAIIITSMKTMP